MTHPIGAPRARSAGILSIGIALAFAASSAKAQAPLSIPAPRGFVNDFAQVITAERAAQMETLARFVRDRSGGEIAIVTLPDIGGREVGDVGLQIGREWKVGAKADIGDARRNAGIVVLLVPKETSSDGRGYVTIQVGQGAEGFIPDAVAADIRREGTAYFAQRDYSSGLTLITMRLAERYAAEFGFSLDSAGVPMARRARGTPQGVPPGIAVLAVIIAIIVLTSSRGRGGCAPFIAGQVLGHAMGRHGRWNRHGGFGGGGWGGGGGGGFGGFGGGGGFSGGGSSGSF